MSDSEETCNHEWEWHHQPFGFLRVCGWKCAKCGEPSLGEHEGE